MFSTYTDSINKMIPEAKAIYELREVGDTPIDIEAESVHPVCQHLKTQFGFHVLEVITGCDYPDRIEVSYILANFTDNQEVILKTKLSRENPVVDSVSDIWSSANFQERECFDMLGVHFNNHPDPRRILCPDDWEGFPLRKDYKTQERYRHMIVNPESKMNIEDREFANKQKALEAKQKALEKTKADAMAEPKKVAEIVEDKKDDQGEKS